MSDIESGTPAGQIYSSDSVGLHEAAANVIARRGGPVSDEPLAGGTELREVINGQDVAEDAPITARRAAKSLSQYRQAVDAQRAQLDEALGLDSPTNDRTAAPVDIPDAIETHQRAQPQAPDPTDQRVQQAAYAQQQAEQQIQYALAAQHQYAQQIADAKRYVEHSFQREFPEIQTTQDLALLQVNDPMRFEQAREAILHNEALIKESMRVEQQQQQVHQAVEQQWSEQQDQIFEQRHPELRDPTAKRAVAELVLNELTSTYGLSQRDVAEMYYGGRPISFRSAIAQDILLDAIRFRAAKRGVRSAARKSAQPVSVVKPGTRSGRMSDTESAAESATRAFRGNPTLRNAAAALAARRRGNQ